MSVATTQRDRLARRFQLWDNDNNGFIQRSDYEAEAKSILRQFGEPEASPQGQAVLTNYRQMWEYIAQEAGVGSDGALDEQTFISVAEQLVIRAGDQGFNRVLRPTIKAIVDLCDTDGDGQVNRQEWKRWAKAIGLPAHEADTAFDGIDANGNGQLTVDELVQAVHDYHAGRSDVELLGR